LARALLGKEQSPRPFLYREFSGYGGQQSVRVGDWKAVRQGLTRNKQIVTELYNIANDVGEQTNIADKHPDVVAKLEALLRDQHVPSKDFPIPALDR
jgi:arylsulfatase